MNRNVVSVDDVTRSQIDLLVTEGGYASEADLLRDMIAERLALREMRSAIAVGLASPRRDYSPEILDDIEASLDRRAGRG